MSTSIDSLELVLKSILSTKPWLRDPNVTPIPWRQDIVDQTLSIANADGSAGKSRLKLGILWTDHVVTPHPPITRGLGLMVDAIKNAGHEVRHPCIVERANLVSLRLLSGSHHPTVHPWRFM
jgi:amidase